MKRLAVLLLLVSPFFLIGAAGATVPTAQPGILSWGGDTEGGAPYMYHDPENLDRIIGFEVEVIESVAEKLRLEPRFVQNGWDNLIPGLERHLYDVSIDGLEITPEHRDAVDFSIPYYVTFLQLAVRRDNYVLKDLEGCRGKVVGTLEQSYAQFVLEKTGGIEIRTYEDEINAFTDLVNGRLDATLFDAPIALFYGGPMREIKFVGPEIGRIEYGIAVRKGEKALLDAINRGLMELRDEGKLREIYERWNLWNPLVARALQDYGPARTAPVMYERWLAGQRPELTAREKLERYVSFIPTLGRGALVTIQVSIVSMILAIALGLGLAVVRVFCPGPLASLATFYIEIIRGTPVLIQLFFIFYGLPNIGIKLDPFTAGALGLGLNYAAYEAEIYRAGLLAVPFGQMEAALGLGMTRWQALKNVVIPQAVRIVVPPVTNDFISLLKDSSLVSVITLVDLTKAYGQLATTYYDYFGTGLIVAALYLLLGLPFVRLARYAEKRLAVSLGLPGKNSGLHRENHISGAI